ncbi:hypothetical protein JKP88DRAFT_222441 [Tribonema minus]|uniref:Uncharacterized protein n=1 Tax=Tribonema minus TaxID=303371 RepID=A0A836CDW5_9STRA|nr:hypothetical protein JKP88DRAFT_222441 [Tribonema minus]
MHSQPLCARVIAICVLLFARRALTVFVFRPLISACAMQLCSSAQNRKAICGSYHCGGARHRRNSKAQVLCCLASPPCQSPSTPHRFCGSHVERPTLSTCGAASQV